MRSENYFSFFGFPVAFNIDEKLLKTQYYENTRRYHPDHFGQEDETKQAEVLELSTRNNAAYNTLKTFNSRVYYILDLHGLVTEGDKHPLPPGFLAEMMDINEALMELEFDPDAAKLAALKGQVAEMENEITTQLKATTTKFDTANDAQKPEILQQVKEHYHKSKYILRIKESLSTFAAL